MSYAQKIKGAVLETVEAKTVKGEDVTRNDLVELAIFFAGLSNIYSNGVKNYDKKFEDALINGYEEVVKS